MIRTSFYFISLCTFVRRRRSLMYEHFVCGGDKFIECKVAK